MLNQKQEQNTLTRELECQEAGMEERREQWSPSNQSVLLGVVCWL